MFGSEICTGQEHWIDQPRNKKDDDINFRRNVLFQNEEILENGRSYYVNEVILAGLKLACIRCRSEVEDHFSKILLSILSVKFSCMNHLTSCY